MARYFLGESPMARFSQSRRLGEGQGRRRERGIPRGIPGDSISNSRRVDLWGRDTEFAPLPTPPASTPCRHFGVGTSKLACCLRNPPVPAIRVDWRSDCACRWRIVRHASERSHLCLPRRVRCRTTASNTRALLAVPRCCRRRPRRSRGRPARPSRQERVCRQ